MAFLTGSGAPLLQRLAVPAVCVLIAFLGYGSQWLFAHSPDLEPGPLTTNQKYTFNTLLVCLWWTYYKACTVDPGRYVFPPPKKTDREEQQEEPSAPSPLPPSTHLSPGGITASRSHISVNTTPITRWCKKCAAPKPPRAHHCKTCRRCVPKMDHHCPWTSNCVSLQTFPHFLRFLVYTNLSLWTLLYFIWTRFLALYTSRHLPAYLGPTIPQLAMLTTFSLVAGLTSLALGILLITTAKGWVLNMTMIEGWEMERHEAVLARRPGTREGDDDAWWGGNGDSAANVSEPVEFPYDIGFFANMAQAMGSSNLLFWFVPFVGGPVVARPPRGEQRGQSTEENMRYWGTGWTYEENDLNDREGMWPPPDPDKVRNARLWRDRKRELDDLNRAYHYQLGGHNTTTARRDASAEEEREAFRRRQERDLQRWKKRRRDDGDDDNDEDREGIILDELEETAGGTTDMGRRSYYYDGNTNKNKNRPSNRDVEEYDFVDEAYRRDDVDKNDYNNHRPRIPARTAGGGPGPVFVREGRPGWVNAEGENLGDYGVDEDAEFDEGPGQRRDYFVDVDDDDADEPKSTYQSVDGGGGVSGGYDDDDDDDDEVPLAELIRRRKVRTRELDGLEGM